MSLKPRQKINCNVNCCVFGCNAKVGRDRDVSFHYLPKINKSKVIVKLRTGNEIKMDRRKAWEYVLASGKPMRDSFRVCSRHFTQDDYILPDIPSSRRFLKKNAVPSLNVPHKTKEQGDKARRLLVRQTLLKSTAEDTSKAGTSFDPVPGPSSEPLPRPSFEPVPDSAQYEAAKILLSLGLSEEHLQINQPVPPIKDAFVQVTSGDMRQFFYSCLISDKQISTATGLPNRKVLDFLVDSLKVFHEKDKISQKLCQIKSY